MKITIRNLQKKIPISPKRIKQVILNTVLSERLRNPLELTVCFLNDKTIKRLNYKFLHKDYATDVIAFDISEGKKAITADIAISTDRALRNAVVYRTSPLYETYLYVIHGVLHILGYDDKTGKERKVMEEKTRKILKHVNI